MRGWSRLTLAVALGAATGACATTPPAPVPVTPPLTASVTAGGETDPVGSAAADAADDPAIWRNPADPGRSLIVATDKKAGLHVYGIDGRSRFFDPAGRLNNVDLVDMGVAGVIVVASDRNDPVAAKLRIYRLDTVRPALALLGSVSGGTGEAYGVCLWQAPDGLHSFSVLKHGAVEEVLIDPAAAPPTSRPVRRLKLATQTEGCVVDPRDGTLYVGEEDVGIWRFAPGAGEGKLVAAVNGRQLVADVEGLALLPEGRDGGLLVASSQGDNAYALYNLPDMVPAGRFRIVAGRLGAAEETDGIALAAGDFGAGYPDGLFIAQDGVNGTAAQNFKLVSWAAVRRSLGQ